MAAVTAERPRKSVISNILRGSLGNLIEWYDFYSYAVFASFIGATFFDKSDALTGALNAFFVFGISFLMRPIGSWFFGRIADRRGRKYALTLSVLMMAFGSLLMAVSPGYAQIGIWATFLLWFARMVEGFSVGGEYGTTATYMSEIATPNRRGFYSSFQYVTLVGGQVVALIVQIILQHVLSKDDLNSWGWRIPFVIGTLAALTVLWLRRGMDESIPQEQVAAAHTHVPAAKIPAEPGTLRLLFTKHWKPFVIVFGLTAGGTSVFYAYTTLMPTYMKQVAHLAAGTVSTINFCALVVYMLLHPVLGILSDRIGRKAMLMVSGVGGVLLTWPILTSLGSVQNPFAAFGLQLLGLVIVCFYTSISAIVKAELFPTSVRALGVGLAYGLANAVFGGSAPYVGTVFIQAKNADGFIIYLIVLIAISLSVCIFGLKNKQETPLDRDYGQSYSDATRPRNKEFSGSAR